MKERILNALKKSDGYISGGKLSEELNVSRTAVWKNINSLKEEGYEIISKPRIGYRLISNPDKLSEKEIIPKLETECIGKKYIYKPEIDSTNEEIKRIYSNSPEGTVVVTEYQTEGKGRLGRRWISPDGRGIYFSILLKPNIQPFESPKITQITAAAVAKTIIDLGIDAKIKWPNDIVVNGRKIAGILTEMSGELMALDYIVVGIGINIDIDSKDFNSDIIGRVGGLRENIEDLDRKELLVNLLKNFEMLYKEFIDNKNIEKSIDICRENSAVLGKKIRIIKKGKEELKKAIDIDEEGGLIVEDMNGNRETIISGEISVRGENSYI
ncbi:MAG: biotin--[acetyl-CoA-carboxylase] ligase [Andreesenia angusta]|nr:biotin--[acetyl-CoA-carboxylase] ligase [Andreesenia angusta]